MKNRPSVKFREISSLRWILIFLIIADGFVCGIMTHLLFSSRLPSVGVVLADSVLTTRQVPASDVSSFELISGKKTRAPVVPNGEVFTLIEASPTPNSTGTLTTVPPPTSEPSPIGPRLVVSSSNDLPRTSVILPPCGPGEEFFHPIDGRGFDATFIGGIRGSKFHPGIDGSCKGGGQAKWIAYAVADAVVVTYKYLDQNGSEAMELWSSGWTAVLAFTFEGAQYEAIYGHLELPNKSENWPKVGDRVGPLSPLGRIGSTGASSGLHLHFGLRRRGPDGKFEFINPEFLLGKRP